MRHALQRSFVAVSSILLAGTALISSAHAASADLSVAIATPVAKIVKGEILSNVITVTNNGPDTSGPFTMMDDVPAGLTFASASNDCSLSGSTVSCKGGKDPRREEQEIHTEVQHSECDM